LQDEERGKKKGEKKKAGAGGMKRGKHLVTVHTEFYSCNKTFCIPATTKVACLKKS
jgi:hypothetical protein